MFKKQIKAGFVLFACFLFSVIPFTIAYGGSDDFAISAIPKDFAKDADAVIRFEKITFFVESPKKAVEKVKRVISIFNSKGRDFGVQVVGYDKFRKLKSFKGCIRNSDGKIVRKLKKSDIRDYVATSNYSLYDDNRVRVGQLYYSLYPYTIEFEYELEHDGLINWKTWYPQVYELPVEQTIFEVNAPVGLKVRYKPRGIDLEPQISQKGKRKLYLWEVSILSKPELESYGPSWEEQMPSVMVASNTFEIDGHSGDMSTWKSFAHFYFQLSQGLGVLPEVVKQKVQQLILNTTDRKARAQKIYDYLQSTTRYVSVQLGIGGWRPFDVKYVFEKKYGDCKALTNYMLAMLKYADIEAYPALVLAGSGKPDVIVDFPSNQFNHVILCLPSKADTLWLECTSQTIPFGHLGTFTEDRNVLVVTPDNGKIVRTPKSSSKHNMQIRKAEVKLVATGHATASIHTTYSGNQQDRVRQALATGSSHERKKWLREKIDLASFDIVKADFSGINKKTKTVSLPLELSIHNYASRSNTRLFFKPNLLERWEKVPRQLEQRSQPVRMPYAFVDIDTVLYYVPNGLSIEAAPEAVKINTMFGEYQAKIEVLGNGYLKYIRKLEIKQNKMPPERYDDFREFLKRVVKADNSQIVLVKEN